MSDLPDLDPSLVDKPSVLHAKLLEAHINADLEAQKATAVSAVEAQKATAASQLEDKKADLAIKKAKEDRSLAEAKEENDGDLAFESAERAKDLELRGLYHQKIMEISGAGIERSRDSAKFVQTAAAGLITAYAVLLGLVFSAKDRPLPLRGIYAATFLGLAIGLAVAYLAFLEEPEPADAYQPGASRAETELARTAAFVDWVNGAIANRRSALRASVIAFGFGIAFIPAPFVGATGGSATTAAGATTPPSIPRDVPLPIEADAKRLFGSQVDAYLAAVNESKASGGAKISIESCSGYDELFNACAWTTDAGVERSFRRLAALAVVLVVLVPAGFFLSERSSRRTPNSSARSVQTKEQTTDITIV